MGPPDSRRLAAADLLRDFYGRSHRVLDRMMASHGASYARTRLLVVIARDGPLRSVDIASAFGHSPRTVTEAVDGLERAGLVRREPDARDRRAKRIVITPLGRAAIEGAEASRLRYIDQVFGALTDAECGELVRLFAKLNDRLGDAERAPIGATEAPR